MTRRYGTASGPNLEADQYWRAVTGVSARGMCFAVYWAAEWRCILVPEGDEDRWCCVGTKYVCRRRGGLLVIARLAIAGREAAPTGLVVEEEARVLAVFLAELVNEASYDACLVLGEGLLLLFDGAA